MIQNAKALMNNHQEEQEEISSWVVWWVFPGSVVGRLFTLQGLVSFVSLWGSRSRLLLFTTGTKLGGVTFSICRNRLDRRGLGGAGEQGEGAACGHRLSRGGVVAQVRVERITEACRAYLNARSHRIREK